MLETVEQRNALLTTIEKMRDSTVLAYILHDNAMVADDALPQLYDKLQSVGKKDRIDLLLNARNGIIEVSWRVLNLLREYCDHLGVIVGSRVQGAASLLALGADEIIMGPLSELGGMEPVRRHPLLPHDESGQPIPLSFGELKGLLEFLSEQSGDSEMVIDDEGRKTKDEDNQANPHSALRTPHSEVVRVLLHHINPLVIAHLKQADTLSRDITRKALSLHMHPEDNEKVDRLVDLFNGGFHSPIYTPSRAELLGAGLPLTDPDKELWAAIWGLVQLYQATVYNDRPENTAPGAFYRYVCLMETVGRLTGLRQSFTQVEGQERVLQIRWDTAIRSSGPGPSYGPGGRSNN
ncbi:MAG TPA: hypothetical protein VJ183_13500 [Chloroflexia bacterium]|nr:hypothetical protein [Chloroflexia bacterium]